MEDKKLTEKESLEVITSMIARTKKRYLGSGNILLMWGYLVVIVTILVSLLLEITQNVKWSWLWFTILIVGCPVSAIMARKEYRESGAVTYSDKVTSRLWTIFGISEIVLSLTCLGFSLIGGINCWGAMLVYSIVAAPCAEIAQGLVIKEKCLIAGGIIGLTVGLFTLCCVVGGIPLSVNWYMPLFIIAWTAMMIIPGHIINHKAKQE